MKAISLWQPWASALFIDIEPGVPMKPHETRHWPLPSALKNGPLVAIHAAKRDTPDEREFWRCIRPSHLAAFRRANICCYSMLPRGAIIGVLRFTDCSQTGDGEPSQHAGEWGNYSAGRFAWKSTDRMLFDQPVPCVGRQGFFEWNQNSGLPPTG